MRVNLFWGELHLLGEEKKQSNGYPDVWGWHLNYYYADRAMIAGLHLQ